MGLGILSGLLGAMGATPDAEGGLGILGRLGQGIHDNSGMLMGFAGGGMEGALQGKRSDMLAAAQRQEQEDKAHRIAAAVKIAPQYGIDPEIAKNDPEAAYKMIQFKMQKEQQDRAYGLQASEAARQASQFQQTLDFQKSGGPSEAARIARDMNLQPGTPEHADFLRKFYQKQLTPQTKWEIKTVKNSDGSETPIYFDPQDPSKTMPVPGFGTGNPKAQAAEDAAKQSADFVVQDIDRVLNAVDNEHVPIFGGSKVVGPLGNNLSGFAGTKAHDVASLLNTIKSNVTFDKLQDMRKNSPTGGALGSVSDTENKLLGSAIASLEQSQSEPQFKQNLLRVKKVYNEVIHGRGNVDDEGNLKTGTAAPGSSSRGSIPSGQYDYVPGKGLVPRQ